MPETSALRHKEGRLGVEVGRVDKQALFFVTDRTDYPQEQNYKESTSPGLTNRPAKTCGMTRPFKDWVIAVIVHSKDHTALEMTTRVGQNHNS